VERGGSEVIDQERAEILHRDCFPVDVTLGDRVVARQARVFVTSRRVLIYAGNMQKVYEAEISNAPERNRGSLVGPLDLNVAEGVLWLNRSGGCGCHSPLKALSPPVSW
jgi:hypothetical protein